MNKYIIGSFIAGAVVAAFVYQVYVNYQFQKAFGQDHQVLANVVNFLSSATQKK